MQVIIKARKPGLSWYHDNVIVFQERITVPANGLVDFVVPGSNIGQTAKSLSLEVSSFGLCIALDTVADPDFELRGGGECFACPASFSSFWDFLFLHKKGEGGGGWTICHWDILCNPLYSHG